MMMKTIEIDGRVYVMRRVRRRWTLVRAALTDRCAYWHSNDGAGLDAEDSVRLADILQAEIDAGRTATYERVYASNQERTPNVRRRDRRHRRRS